MRMRETKTREKRVWKLERRKKYREGKRKIGGGNWRKIEAWLSSQSFINYPSRWSGCQHWASWAFCGYLVKCDKKVKEMEIRKQEIRKLERQTACTKGKQKINKPMKKEIEMTKNLAQRNRSTQKWSQPRKTPNWQFLREHWINVNRCTKTDLKSERLRKWNLFL